VTQVFIHSITKYQLRFKFLSLSAVNEWGLSHKTEEKVETMSHYELEILTVKIQGISRKIKARWVLPNIENIFTFLTYFMYLYIVKLLLLFITSNSNIQPSTVLPD